MDATAAATAFNFSVSLLISSDSLAALRAGCLGGRKSNGHAAQVSGEKGLQGRPGPPGPSEAAERQGCLPGAEKAQGEGVRA
ncbi:hypothetical protein ASNO1_05010 [Corallococcus caeni]|uniref:Collagen-like protein n=1 Tax=Corallococcus caeni TaxID=3082388 RepID=A0ABQ6QJQ6_9BACT|nr:hypothetical protein ASNO1_05010 [Corallococcus sp. NO1]